jgi:hypothetical protein
MNFGTAVTRHVRDGAADAAAPAGDDGAAAGEGKVRPAFGPCLFMR